jgi:hypothetical protein
VNEFILPADRDWNPAIARLLRFVEQLDHGKPHVVKVERWRKERSDLQNRALWGVAYKTLSDATGHDPEDLHTYFCGEFYGWEEYEIMGQIRKRPKRSTTKDEHGKRDVVSTVMLSDFYAFIQRRSAETVGIYVPDPDPEWWTQQ